MDNSKCANCGRSTFCNEQTLAKNKENNNQETDSEITLPETFMNLTMMLKLDKLRMCEDCEKALKVLSNCRKVFLQQTKSNSKIQKIFNAEDKSNDKENNDKISANGYSANQDESILPIVEEEADNSVLASLQTNQELHEKPVQLMYKEKFPVLKITPLSGSSASPLKQEIDTKKICTVCKRNFEDEEKKNEHIKSVHQNNVQEFECRLCSETFWHQWFYKHHVKFEHGGMEIYLSCAICKKKFHSQTELDEHKFTAHGLTTHPFKCIHCDVAFETKEEVKLLREHLIENHMDTKEAKDALFNKNFLIEKEKARKKDGHRPCFVNSCPTIFSSAMARCAHVLFDHYSQKSCLVCQKVFESADDLHTHSKTCPQTECSECGKKLTLMFYLAIHWDTVHNLNITYPFNCEVCGNSFHYFNHLRGHYAWHVRVAKPKLFDCNQCGKNFMAKHGLLQHLRLTHSYVEKESPTENSSNTLKQSSNGRNERSPRKNPVKSTVFRCEQCELPFKSFQGLNRHRRTHMKLEKVGRLSGAEGTSGEDKLSNYITFITDEERQFVCNQCKTAFKRLDHCFRHLYGLHNVRLGKYKDQLLKCQFCTEVCTDSYRLRRHERSHKPTNRNYLRKKTIKLTKIICCSICGEECATVDQLRAHFIKSHENTREAELAHSNIERQKEVEEDEKKGRKKTANICSFCNNYFFTIEEREKHEMNAHEADRQCKSCEQEFDSKKELEAHESRHENFPCNLCSSILENSQTFQSHLQNEHTQLAFVCEFCEKPFSKTSTLNKHCRWDHLGNTPFTCDLCEPPNNKTTFKCKDSLMEHLQQQHTPELYECTECKIFYNQFERFKEHKESVHKDFGSVTCKICAQCFHDVLNLSLHKVVAHSNEEYSKEVAKSFAEKKFLNLGLFYSVKRQNYKCPSCDMFFKNGKHLKRHLQKTCSQLRKKEPSEEEKKKISIFNIRWSLLVKSNELQNNECPDCGIVLSSRDILRVHMLKNCSRGRKNCPTEEEKEKISNLNIRSNSSLKSKVELEKFPCPDCGVTVSRKDHLTRHMRKSCPKGKQDKSTGPKRARPQRAQQKSTKRLKSSESSSSDSDNFNFNLTGDERESLMSRGRRTSKRVATKKVVYSDSDSTSESE